MFLGTDWDGFVTHWYLGLQPAVTPTEASMGLEALSTYAPEKYAKLIDDDSPRGSAVIEPALRFGLRLDSCKHLQGFDELIRRIRSGDPGARAELHLAASLVKLGYAPELEPETGHGKRNDAVVEVEQRRVFFEVTAPEQSEMSAEALRHAEDFVGRVLAAAPAGNRVEVWLTNAPTDSAADAVIAAISANLPLVDGRLIEIAGIGYVRRVEAAESAGVEPPNVDLPRFGIARARGDAGIVTQVNLRFPALEDRLARIMEHKSEQLNVDNVNVVVIHVNDVPGKVKLLATKVLRRLQPGLNRRFSAIVLVKSGFHADKVEVRHEWEVVVNPNSYQPIPEILASQLSSLNEISL